MHKACDLNGGAELRHHAAEGAVACRIEHQSMDGRSHVIGFALVFRADEVLMAVDQLGQLVQLLFRNALRSHPGTVGLQGNAHIIDFGDLIWIGMADDAAPIRLDLDEAIPGQHAQCLANRRVARPKSDGDIVIFEPCARSQFTG